MKVQNMFNRSVALALGIGLLLVTSWAHADPPSRVARLGYADGLVSFSPAGQSEWVQATVNRPLTTGDRLWVDANSRAELQIGGAAMRLGERTDVTLLRLDDNVAQMQLVQGALKMRVRSVAPNQSIEIDTPNLAFTLRRAGDYRIDVDPRNDATTVAVESGEAQVVGAGAAYTVSARQGYRFHGTGLSDYETVAAGRDDDLDQWARERDRLTDNSTSARYVSVEVVGYEDLDANGIWRADPSYGYVWTPSRMVVGWTPYRDGHWAWVDPWGWTWIDAAPWGFAVSHYGRWAHINNAWCWVPGPPRARAVYAPALVAFLGGAHFQATVSVGAGTGNVGWFPLAPHEVYQPAYRVSRGYFDNINRSNAVIAPATITNIYNTHVTNETHVTPVTYVNQRVAGAVVAVPVHAFAQSKPVAKASVTVANAVAFSAPTTHVVAVAPAAQTPRGGPPDARAQPPTHAPRVVARTAPPAAPLEEPRRLQLKPFYPAEAGTRNNAVTAAQAEAARANAARAAATKAEVPSESHHGRGPKSEAGEKRDGEKRRFDEDGRRH